MPDNINIEDTVDPDIPRTIPGLPRTIADLYNIEELALLKAQTKDVKQNTDLRKEYAAKVYWFLVSWCLVVFVLLTCSSCSAGVLDSFKIPETVLSILVGSTTVSAIGLVGLIVKGLFNAPLFDK